jgi:type IV pilus assembly protein PilC
MAIYLWTAKARSGDKKSGELEANSSDAVVLHLKNMGLTPGKVKAKPKDISEILPFLAPKITIKDLVVFTRQFAV